MKRDIYEQITTRVIELLAQGVAPWRRPWKVSGTLPKNLKSGKTYRGINLVVLAISGFASPYWVTFNQAKDLGGQVRAGAKGTQVVFWKFLHALKGGDAGTVWSGASEVPRAERIPLLRCYTVFNLDQTEGLASSESAGAVMAFNPIESAERLIRDLPNPPEIRRGGQQAYYDANNDLVVVPPETAFQQPEMFYHTLMHEIAHASGHQSRLARPAIVEGGVFGSCDYSKEELVAELSAAFISATIGLEVELEQSASYLKGWMTKLSNDHRLLLQAASQAQRAAEYVLGIKHEDAGEAECTQKAEQKAA